MLRKTQLQGRSTVCTPVGLSRKEKCRKFQGIPQPEQADPKNYELQKKLPERTFWHRDHYLKQFNFSIMFIHTWKLAFLQPDQESGTTFSEGKACPGKKCVSNSVRQSYRATDAHPLEFHRRKSAKSFRDFLNQNKSCELRRTASMTHILTLRPLIWSTFFPSYTHGNSVSCNVLSRIREDLLGRQSMSQKEMCLKLRNPEKSRS